LQGEHGLRHVHKLHNVHGLRGVYSIVYLKLPNF
jgi:hypothetical protein